MNETFFILIALTAGFLLGLFFFGGLWWTTQKGVHSKMPALWFFGSFIVRTGTTIAGFYLISQNHWERVILCLLGFLIARFLVTHLTKPKEVKQQ